MSSLPSPAPGPRPLPVAGPVHPSFPLVGAHFGAAFLWSVAGGAGLVWIAPVLATGQFLDPRVLAVTHLFTLGFLTTVITGVLYQIFPAMLGIGERSRRVAWWGLGLYPAGTALLAGGLLLGERRWQSAGWCVLFAAVYGTAWNLLPQRRRAPRNRQLGLYLSYAHIGFGCAMAVAGARIGDALGWWTTPRLGLISAHFHLAIAGFVGMTAIGMGSRMLPMFYGTAAPLPAWADTWLPRVLGSGTLLYALGAIIPLPPLAWAGSAGMVASAGLFLWFGFGWFRRRARRALDPATLFLTLALASLLVALPLGLAAGVLGLHQPGILLGYATTLVIGWSCSLVLGVSYRVLPTLTWHHRFGARAGRPGTPALSAMLTPALGYSAAVVAALGLPALVVGIVAHRAEVARLGAALVALGFLLTTLHHARMLLRGHDGPNPGVAP